LTGGIPVGISAGFGAALTEAASVCFDEQKQRCGVELNTYGNYTNEIFEVYWPIVTDLMRRTWRDSEVTTEHGAYGVALLLIRELTNFTVIEISL
jgi:hypothetical protein